MSSQAMTHSTPTPSPSLDLVRRVNDTALAYTLARLEILERIPGNPIGVAYHTVGSATALAARNLPSPSFNSVVGLRQGRANDIQALVEWSRRRGSAGRFEIAAGDHDPAMGREPAWLEIFQSGFHAALIGGSGDRAPDTGGIAVDPVSSVADWKDFLEAYLAGWGIPAAERDQFASNVRAWFGEPGWSLQVGRIDGRPAAAAILFVRDGIGYFADAATVPEFRGRGLHAALLSRRWRDAAAAGVEIVCGGADFLSTSHRNMERAGMRLLFLRAIWTPFE